MTEADMDKADKKELAAKVENAKNILYQVNYMSKEGIFSTLISLVGRSPLCDRNHP